MTVWRICLDTDMIAHNSRIGHDCHLLQEAMSAGAGRSSPICGKRDWGHGSRRQVADKGLLCWLWRRLLCGAKCSPWSAHATVMACRWVKHAAAQCSEATSDTLATYRLCSGPSYHRIE